MLELVRVPHPVLTRQARRVRLFDEALSQLAEELTRLMREEEGIGIAAPQAGVSRRLIVVQHYDETLVIANPTISRRRGEEIGTEGCLSIPGYVAEVPRAQYVLVRGQDLQGKKIEVEGQGLLSRVLQHEIDHLDGILIDKRAVPGTFRPARPEDAELMVG